MSKEFIKKALYELDTAANNLDRVASLIVDGEVKSFIVSVSKNIDETSDKIQVAAFGKEALKAHQAKVLQKDSDEPYMDTFNNTVEPLQTDADETFMHKVDQSFNSKAQDTFDADRSSMVTNRDEYDVRDVSEWADGTKAQPSWTGGKGGKSTRQGSTYDLPREAPKKEWA